MDEEAIQKAIETEATIVAGKRAFNMLRSLQAIEVRVPIPDERFDGRELEPIGRELANVFLMRPVEYQSPAQMMISVKTSVVIFRYF